jgi:CBS domain-containing protein
MEDQTEVKVGDRMTRGVITITPSESCQKALLMMHAAGINHLPVVDEDRLVGILTERDILRRAPEQKRAADAGSRRRLLAVVNVAGVMTYAPQTVDPQASLREAVGVMLHRHIGCLPVVQSGQLIGIFTTRDAISILAPEGPRRGDGGEKGG